MQDLAFPLFSQKRVEFFKVQSIGPSLETGLHWVLVLDSFKVRKEIKVLCEQTRELTHDFLDYV